MSKLHAKDLMVGDWIMVDNCPKKVTSIMITDNGVEQIYTFGKTCQVGTLLFSIQPIPLTTEILEKNGCVYDYDHEECVADYTYVTIKGYQYHEENVLIDYCNGHIRLINDITNTVVDIDINYVHELQHALKLCGIEKEVQL